MSNATRIPSISPPHTPKSSYHPSNSVSFSNSGSSMFGSCLKIKVYLNAGRLKATVNLSQNGSITAVDSSSPVSIELKPIVKESQFDRVIGDAQRIGESVLVLWEAKWCRKCIYLKPKLEKLAADYHSRVKFYCIDVNNVPYQLVVRAGVSKMPTVQLWKDGKKQAEVIGGNKAYLVANEVREMLDDGGQP